MKDISTELLFCNAAILVEGPSELYIIPELARALDFDLDLHGVILANVSGTDFAPYRSLLGGPGLRVPNVVITDGDPLNKNDEYRLFGLKRAARLLNSDEVSTAKFLSAHKKLIAGGPSATADELRRVVSEHEVFVGVTTLETDLAPLLATQMVKAMNELEDSRCLRNEFRSAINGSTHDAPDLETQRTILRRINRVSKGRYAQRLAFHVSEDAESIYEHLSESIVAELDSDPGDVESNEPFDWMSLSRYGYVLAAIDRVSQIVRGHGLLENADVAAIAISEEMTSGS